MMMRQLYLYLIISTTLLLAGCASTSTFSPVYVTGSISTNSKISATYQTGIATTYMVSNTFYDLVLTIPQDYIIGSNSYGIEDVTKADSISIRKASSDYTGVPTLDIFTLTQLEPGETLENIVQNIYDINNKNHQVTTPLQQTTIDGIKAYQFGLTSSFSTLDGGMLFEKDNGMVTMLYHKNQLIIILQAGEDITFSDIVRNITFN